MTNNNNPDQMHSTSIREPSRTVTMLDYEGQTVVTYSQKESQRLGSTSRRNSAPTRTLCITGSDGTLLPPGDGTSALDVAAGVAMHGYEH